jgi:hypothetical protein
LEAAIKELIAACKGHLDLLAFVAIGVLTAAVAIGTASTPLTLAFAMIMAFIWVGSRYALYKLQSQERLRNMRHESLARSGQILTERVPEDELELIAWSNRKKDVDNER